MRISNLEKTLGAFSLRIDELKITEPGIYGLIGSNGSGKTTAAKLIAGLIPRDSGTVDYEELDARDITMLPPKPYMINDTVYNNLVYPLRLRGIKPDAALCDYYLEKIGLAERRKQHARSLSSGERQKLAMARAMIFEPKLLIVDEALTDLDMDSLYMFEQMILETQRLRPVIWIMISHHLPHIRRLCEYIFFMANGHLEAEGAADDMLKSENPMVRQYLKNEIVEI